MRYSILFTFILCSLSIILISAEPVPLDRRVREPLQLEERSQPRPVQFGRPDQAYVGTGKGQDSRGTRKEDDGNAANYLITLERNVTNATKDKILDVLLRSGAVVKQTYDYRVFKGILFTIPTDSDKGLTSWQASLEKQEGVKYVEEDSIVHITV